MLQEIDSAVGSVYWDQSGRANVELQQCLGHLAITTHTSAFGFCRKCEVGCCVLLVMAMKESDAPWLLFLFTDTAPGTLRQLDAAA